MGEATQDDPRQQILQLIRRINDAWLKGNPDDLDHCFHDDVVVVRPGVGGRAVGRRACVDSYKDFAGQATVRDFKESSLAVDVWGDTAVATYRFELDYRIDGRDHHEIGNDVLVFAREGDAFRAVWRTVVPVGGAQAART